MNPDAAAESNAMSTGAKVNGAVQKSWREELKLLGPFKPTSRKQSANYEMLERKWRKERAERGVDEGMGLEEPSALVNLITRRLHPAAIRELSFDAAAVAAGVILPSPSLPPREANAMLNYDATGQALSPVKSGTPLGAAPAGTEPILAPAAAAPSDEQFALDPAGWIEPQAANMKLHGTDGVKKMPRFATPPDSNSPATAKPPTDELLRPPLPSFASASESPPDGSPDKAKERRRWSMLLKDATAMAKSVTITTEETPAAPAASPTSPTSKNVVDALKKMQQGTKPANRRKSSVAVTHQAPAMRRASAAETSERSKSPPNGGQRGPSPSSGRSGSPATTSSPAQLNMLTAIKEMEKASQQSSQQQSSRGSSVDAVRERNRRASLFTTTTTSASTASKLERGLSDKRRGSMWVSPADRRRSSTSPEGSNSSPSKSTMSKRAGTSADDSSPSPEQKLGGGFARVTSPTKRENKPSPPQDDDYIRPDFPATGPPPMPVIPSFVPKIPHFHRAAKSKDYKLEAAKREAAEAEAREAAALIEAEAEALAIKQREAEAAAAAAAGPPSPEPEHIKEPSSASDLSSLEPSNKSSQKASRDPTPVDPRWAPKKVSSIWAQAAEATLAAEAEAKEKAAKEEAKRRDDAAAVLQNAHREKVAARIAAEEAEKERLRLEAEEAERQRLEALSAEEKARMAAEEEAARLALEEAEAAAKAAEEAAAAALADEGVDLGDDEGHEITDDEIAMVRMLKLSLLASCQLQTALVAQALAGLLSNRLITTSSPTISGRPEPFSEMELLSLQHAASHEVTPIACVNTLLRLHEPLRRCSSRRSTAHRDRSRHDATGPRS